MGSLGKTSIGGSIHRIREFELEKVNLADEFDILQIVGEGWFGKILLVEHKATDTEMVVKALPKPYTAIRDFYREFHYGLHLGAHKNIITTYDVSFETAGFYVFSQEYAPLGDLTSNVTETGIGELHTKRVAKQLAAALEHLHSRDLVHRDVKLDNVLVFKSDFSRIKLCDFGETRRTGTVVHRRNEWLPYAPPEVLQISTDNSYKAATSHDVWQFGIVIFVCLTGCLPWQKAALDDPRYCRYFSWHTSNIPIKRMPKLFKLVSSKAQKLFKKYLDPKPDKRPSGLAEVHRYMEDRWMSKTGLEKTTELPSEEEGLCPSMYSFHSSPEEKNKLLFSLTQYGLETTVDRCAKKDRIRQWIQSSVIEEEDEDEEEEGDSDEDLRIKDHRAGPIGERIADRGPISHSKMAENGGQPRAQNGPIVGQNGPIGRQSGPIGVQNGPIGGQNGPIGGPNGPNGGQGAPIGGKKGPIGVQNGPNGGQITPIGGQTEDSDENLSANKPKKSSMKKYSSTLSLRKFPEVYKPPIDPRIPLELQRSRSAAQINAQFGDGSSFDSLPYISYGSLNPSIAQKESIVRINDTVTVMENNSASLQSMMINDYVDNQKVILDKISSNGGAIANGITATGIVATGVMASGVVGNGSIVNGPMANGPMVKGTMTSGPITNGPMANGPMTNGPMTNGGMINGPMSNGPMVKGSMVNGPMINGRMVNGPMINGPIANGPIVNGPIVNGPTVNGPMVNGPMANRLMSNGPMANGPISNGPMANGSIANGLLPNGSVPNGSITNGANINRTMTNVAMNKPINVNSLSSISFGGNTNQYALQNNTPYRNSGMNEVSNNSVQHSINVQIPQSELYTYANSDAQNNMHSQQQQQDNLRQQDTQQNKQRMYSTVTTSPPVRKKSIPEDKRYVVYNSSGKNPVNTRYPSKRPTHR